MPGGPLVHDVSALQARQTLSRDPDGDLPLVAGPRPGTHPASGQRVAVYVSRYIDLAASLGREATSVPAFLFCHDMVVGYATEATTGALLRQKLLTCYQRLQEGRRGSKTSGQ